MNNINTGDLLSKF